MTSALDIRRINLLHTEMLIAQGAYEQRRHSADARKLRTTYIRAKILYRQFWRLTEGNS